jgi:hypothetical protein
MKRIRNHDLKLYKKRVTAEVVKTHSSEPCVRSPMLTTQLEALTEQKNNC